MGHKQLYFFTSGKNLQDSDVSTTFRLSLDRLILFGVILVILFILSFSFGVKRGKSLRLAEVNIESNNRTSNENKIKNSKKVNVNVIKEKSNSTLAEQPKINTKIETVGKSKYYVRVASFRKEATANKEAKKLKAAGYDASVKRIGIYSVINVGNFHNKNEADKSLNLLRNIYKDCSIKILD